jgi:hypothetical protein
MRCPHCSHTLPFVGWSFKMKDGNFGKVTKISQGNLTIKKMIGGILCGGIVVWPENRIEELVWKEPAQP